jgi:peptide/nickel transport system permease protein
MRVVPGDPVAILLGDWGDVVSDEHIEMIRVSLGLDRPMWQQYLLFLRSIVMGEFGVSFRTGETVMSMIADRFPLTFQLAIAGFTVAVIIGVPVGILAALKQNTWVDRAAMLFTMLGLSAPGFWVGLTLLYFLAFRLDLFPLFGAQRDGSVLPLVHALVLPAITVGYRSAALLARVTRGALLEVLGANYVTVARAKGLKERIVIAKHALGNAALPVLTVLGTNVAYLLGGSVIVEVVFSRPGMGRLLVDAIFARDYPVVQGAVLIFALLVVFANVVTDILYGIADPRVRASEG